MSKVGKILKKLSKEKYIVLAIFSLGLFLRLFGSLLVGIVFDEGAWLEAARKVSFSPKNFHFVYHGVFHPFFEVYLIKLSIFLFKHNLLNLISTNLGMLFSIRFLHVLLSSATIIIIYFLVKEGLGRSQATFAALIIAFSQFHIHFSRTVIQTAPLLFFVSLSLLFFWKAVNQNKDKFILFTGISIGFGYLCEETAVLLFVIFFIYLLVTKRLIQLLKKWETYVAILAFLFIISPDLYWNLNAQNSDIKFHLTRAARFQGVSLLPMSLFIGELFLMFVKDIVSFVGGFGKPTIWPMEYPPMHWVLGVLCLFAAVYSFKKRKNDFVKLMLTIFLFIFLFFTFLASTGPLGNFNFWWASICFIPAIVLVSNMFSEIFHKGSFLKWLPFVFVFYFFCHSIYFLSITDQIYVRRSSFLIKFYIHSGREFLLKGDISWALDNFRKALKYEPKSITAMINLGECYKWEGQHLQAESFHKKAQEVMSLSYAHRFLFDRGYLKDWLINGYYKFSDIDADEINDSAMVNSFLNLERAKNIKAHKYEKIASPSAFIDLKKILKSPPKTFSYALTQIYSPIPQKVSLLMGVDDGLTIWLNREKIYENNEKFWWHPDEDIIHANLIQGWNELLLRVFYAGGQYYGFSIRLADSEGEIMDNIRSKAFYLEITTPKSKN